MPRDTAPVLLICCEWPEGNQNSSSLGLVPPPTSPPAASARRQAFAAAPLALRCTLRMAGRPPCPVPNGTERDATAHGLELGWHVPARSGWLPSGGGWESLDRRPGGGGVRGHILHPVGLPPAADWQPAHAPPCCACLGAHGCSSLPFTSEDPPGNPALGWVGTSPAVGGTTQVPGGTCRSEVKTFPQGSRNKPEVQLVDCNAEHWYCGVRCIG